jgi:hypothetical protein
VLGETVMMIPDTRGRLERGVEDLQALLVRRQGVPASATAAAAASMRAIPCRWAIPFN